MSGVAEDTADVAGFLIPVDEQFIFDPVITLPSDGEVRFRVLDLDRQAFTLTGEGNCQLVGRI